VSDTIDIITIKCRATSQLAIPRKSTPYRICLNSVICDKPFLVKAFNLMAVTLRFARPAFLMYNELTNSKKACSNGRTASSPCIIKAGAPPDYS
jgi:hypothetical protein